MFAWKQFFLDLLYPPPPRCFLCGQKSKGKELASGLCQECLSLLRTWKREPFCPICGRFGGHYLCRGCLLDKPFFQVARSVGPYTGLLRQAVHRLKNRRNAGCSEVLGSLLADVVRGEERYGSLQVVVPVPLHLKKLRERSFNQAELLAGAAARSLQLPLLKNCLVKKIETADQTDLDRSRRRRNLQGVFAVNSPERVAGKNVLLVDDVLTTGVTVRECARALSGAGARSVAAVVLAAGIRKRKKATGFDIPKKHLPEYDNYSSDTKLLPQ